VTGGTSCRVSANVVVTVHHHQNVSRLPSGAWRLQPRQLLQLCPPNALRRSNSGQTL